VEAGAVLGDLCQSNPGKPLALQTVQLQTSHRFGGPIGQLARAINAGQGEAALALLQTGGPLTLSLNPDPQAMAIKAASAYRPLLEMLDQGPRADHEAWVRQLLEQFDTFRVLCALRDGPWGVSGLNAAITQQLAGAGLLQTASTSYPGRPVMVTRNDALLGVFNGDIGLTLPAPDGVLRIYFVDGQTLRSVAPTRLSDLETAWAMTVHKSQGSEFNSVLLALPPQDSTVLTRELLYTGITRAKQTLCVAASDPQILVRAAGLVTQRFGGLSEALGR
jgi:exodeoxyribonuclease V alpha subunit